MSTYKDKLESHHQSCLNDAGKLIFFDFYRMYGILFYMRNYHSIS